MDIMEKQRIENELHFLLILSSHIVFDELETQSQILGFMHNRTEELEQKIKDSEG